MKCSFLFAVILIVLLSRPLLSPHAPFLDDCCVNQPQLIDSVLASNGYTNVSVAEAKQMIETNPDLVIVDVRSQDEYNRGHIENAVSISKNELESRIGELDSERATLVYCVSGWRSAAACQILIDNGFVSVYNMLGGITAWRSAGYWIEITHEGDLVVDGTQTFVIENCKYIQTGAIILTDYAKLVVRDSELIMNISGQFEWSNSYYAFQGFYSIITRKHASIISSNSTINTMPGSLASLGLTFFDSSSGLFNFTNMYNDPPLTVQIQTHDNSQIRIINSELNRLEGGYDFSNVEIANSTCQTIGCCDRSNVNVLHSKISELTICFSQQAIVTVENFYGGEGHVTYFNTFKNMTVTGNSVANLTIRNSEFMTVPSAPNLDEGITLHFRDSSTGNISQSSFPHVHASNSSQVTIHESRLGQAHIQDNSSIWVKNSEVNWFGLWGTHYSEYPKAFVYNSTLQRLTAFHFIGIVEFDNAVIGAPFDGSHPWSLNYDINCWSSQFYIHGNVSFTESAKIEYWDNTNVTRNFKIIITNQIHNSLAHAELTLYDQNLAVIWKGTADSSGQANFNLTFTDNNCTDTLRLEALQGNHTASASTSFLSNTPMIMKMRYFADLNADGTINILDITIVAMAYGSTPGDQNWNELADLDRNGIINIIDISTVARDYGKTV